MDPNDSQHDIHKENYGALGAELTGKINARGMWGTYDGGMSPILCTLPRYLYLLDPLQVSTLSTKEV